MSPKRKKKKAPPTTHPTPVLDSQSETAPPVRAPSIGSDRGSNFWGGLNWTNPLIYLAIAAAIFQAGMWVGGMNDFRATVSDAIGEIRSDVKEILRRSSRSDDGLPDQK